MEQKLREIMAAVFEVPLEAVTADTSVNNLEAWQSLQHMRLVLALEESFNVHLDPDEVTAMLDFKSILETLRRHT